jgi:hypothetical protein
MMVTDWIILAVLFILPFVVIVWIYFKRRRLFYNMNFTAQTTWMNYQNESKYRAMELVQYQEEEKDDDENGEKEMEEK